MTLSEKKENLILKENNSSIEERFKENNNARNEDISVKFNNNNINNKINFNDSKANPINEEHHEIVNNNEFNPIYNLIKLFNNNNINSDVSKIYNNIYKQMKSEEKNEKSDKIAEGTKLLDNNKHKNLDENSPILKIVMDKYSEVLYIIKRQEEKIQQQEEKMQQQEEKMQQMKDELLFDKTKNEFDRLELKCKIMIETELNYNLIEVERSKIDYLEGIIVSLKNTINNLVNPYNFNLWRKLSNIILKNVFVILNKNKNYSISQKAIQSTLDGLQDLNNKYKIKEEKKLKAFQGKLKKLNSEIKNTKKQSIFKGSPAADKERNFSLIIISKNNVPDIKINLSVEFLFFIKEKGNKLNHFDQELLNLLLFEDLDISIEHQKESDEKENQNIIINKEDEECEEGEKDNEDIIQKKYNGKTLFSSEELIEMLKNPFKFKKKEIDSKKILELINIQINEIKNEMNPLSEKDQLIDLINEIKNINNTINNLKEKYDNILKKNGINFLEKIDETKGKDKDKLNLFKEIRKLQQRIIGAISLYEKINNKLTELREIKDKKKLEIKNMLDINKSKNITKSKIISLQNLFDGFKKQLLLKIEKWNEYQEFSDIFNSTNVTEFTLNDFLLFLKSHLKSDYSFSIVKKDITNYNLLIEVVNNFREFAAYYNKNLDVLI